MTTTIPTLSMTTAKGRAAIVARIVAAIREAAPDADVAVNPGWLDDRETRIGATLNGATFFTSVKADSTWGILGGWHTRDRKFCSSFGAETGGGVNPYHFGKATGPSTPGNAGKGRIAAASLDWFCGRVALCFASVANESAFQDAAS